MKTRSQAKAKVSRRSAKRWISRVKTDSTHPPAGLFTKDAATIACVLRSRKGSPKGPASGLRMLTYFINRAGKGLSRTRKAELERAKRLMLARSRRTSRAKSRKKDERRVIALAELFTDSKRETTASKIGKPS